MISLFVTSVCDGGWLSFVCSVQVQQEKDNRQEALRREEDARRRQAQKMEEFEKKSRQQEENFELRSRQYVREEQPGFRSPSLAGNTM